MIIKLQLCPYTAAKLPAAYNSRLQGVIYNLLSSSEDYSTFLHDKGYGENKTGYKIFCFGPLRGRYMFDHRARRIVFNKHDTITWEVRSPDRTFGKLLLEALLKRESLMIADQRFKLKACEILESEIDSQRVSIRMQSPLVVHRMLRKDGKNYTKYYNPLDDEFDELIRGNFVRKMRAFHDVPPQEDIQFAVLRIGKKDKVVTRYRGIYITGWKGEYELRGSSESIRFLYETGLGTRNSSGFGLFDIIEK